MIMELAQTLFQQWKKSTTDRQKMQHTYIVAAILLLLFGGCSALVNLSFGLSIAQIAVVLFFIFIANVVVYRVITLPLVELSRKPTQKKR